MPRVTHWHRTIAIETKFPHVEERVKKKNTWRPSHICSSELWNMNTGLYLVMLSYYFYHKAMHVRLQHSSIKGYWLQVTLRHQLWGIVVCFMQCQTTGATDGKGCCSSSAIAPCSGIVIKYIYSGGRKQRGTFFSAKKDVTNQHHGYHQHIFMYNSSQTGTRRHTGLR